MKKYILKTHGCKSNQLESAVIKEKLENAGYSEAKKIDEADYFILNSCSVTENADNEALRTVRHAKKQNDKIITIVTGCSAQLKAKELIKHNFIDIVLGNNDKFEIIEAIKNYQSKVTDIFKVKEFNNQVIHNYSNTRGYLKIQDGCNNYCSYCTIPFARGKSRSNSVENIIDQIKYYTDIGIKEVVLTGIHIGQWGEDIASYKNLAYLLEEIEKTEIKRYRLGSLNTIEINDKLLDFLSQSEKFCPHFHLSLQSLNNKILKLMNRHYSSESCMELMEKIDEKFQKPFIGSDLIVGFPNETEEDFEDTMTKAQNSKLSNIHVFPYSIRKNTKAALMDNQINEKVKNNRAAIMHKIAQEKFTEFKNKNIGLITDVLIEKRPDKKTGFLKGVTSNYLTVLINNNDKTLHNQIRKAEITEIKKNTGDIFAELL